MDKEIQLKDIGNYLLNTVCYGSMAIGAYVWLFHFIPDVVGEKENFRFIFTRHLFYYLQIMLTTSGFLLAHLIFRPGMSKKTILVYFMISSALIHFNFFRVIHGVIREYNLYFSVFKTSPDGSMVTSFQYARIFMISIVCALLLWSMVFVKRNLLKVFFVFLCASFFGMFYFMHLYIGRQTYLEYQERLRTQVETIMDNFDNAQPFCEKLNYQCFIIDNDKPFTYAKPNILNRVDSQQDSTLEANQVIGEKFTEFKHSAKPSLIYMESNIVTDNLRGIAFAFKQISPRQTFVVIDYVNLVYALDLYLLYFTLAINVFLAIWITGIVWLYKVHRKMPVMKKLDLVQSSHYPGNPSQ